MARLDFTHGGNIYEIERKHKKKIIDFSASINPLGVTARTKEAVYRSLTRLGHYPDAQEKELTAEIARYWEVKTDNVLIGNGSVELIYLVARVFKPATVWLPAPTFCEYERAAKIAGAGICFTPLNKKDFTLRLSRLPCVDLAFFCNPNNPTGNLIGDSRRIAAALPAKTVVADEAFMDFVPQEKKLSLVAAAARDKGIVVCRTFTKFFALPGLRAGYLIAHKEVIRLLKQHQAPWSSNVCAQAAAQEQLRSPAYIKKTRRFIEEERRYLIRRIREIARLFVYPSAVNFLLVKIEGELTSTRLRERLITKGILIRDCADFRGLNNKFFRIAVRGREENAKLVSALKAVL